MGEGVVRGSLLFFSSHPPGSGETRKANGGNRDGMKVRGTPWKQYLKETSYKDEILAFKAVLARIGEAQGWTVQDLQDRFSGPLLDDIFF